MPASTVRDNLPADFPLFSIEEIENPKYGHEEIWSLNDKKTLEELGLKMLKIEIHQDMVQSISFKNENGALSRNEAFNRNLQKVGLRKEDLKKLNSEYRFNNKDGTVIRVLGDGDYYQCFEYHAGH